MTYPTTEILVFSWLALIAGSVAALNRYEKKDNAKKLLELQLTFVQTAVDSIKETLALHPDTPAETLIIGQNRERPLAFGRIYSKDRDYMFPIHTPTQRVYNEYGPDTLEPSTDARLEITGSVGDYRVTLTDNQTQFIYSSLTDEITGGGLVS
jgi:hypothetical protein